MNQQIQMKTENIAQIQFDIVDMNSTQIKGVELDSILDERLLYLKNILNDKDELIKMQLALLQDEIPDDFDI